LTREEREQFLIMLLHETEAVEIIEEVQACRDPKDDKFLELAVNGQASYIVTGDRDLLVLNPFRGISILQSADFLVVLSQAPKSKPS
jgi:predicted nucleic acid-binding protein